MPAIRSKVCGGNYPSPTARGSNKCTTKNRSENTCQTPHCSRKAKVRWPFSLGGIPAENGQDSNINPNSTKSRNRTTNDEGIHILRAATKRRTGLEDDDGDNVQILGIEGREDLPPGKEKRGRRERESICEPGDFGHGFIAKILDHSCLDIGDDGIV